MRLSRTLHPAAVVLGLTFASLSSAQSAANEGIVSARAKAIHNSAIVVDTHEDAPLRFLDKNYDIGSTDPNEHDYISLDAALAGNLTAEFFSIFVYPPDNQLHFTKRALELIDSVYEQAARHSERMMMAFSSERHRTRLSAAQIGRAHGG
jgi:membrane dipeptidase